VENIKGHDPAYADKDGNPLFDAGTTILKMEIHRDVESANLARVVETQIPHISDDELYQELQNA
jgi:hypothetical protein